MTERPQGALLWRKAKASGSGNCVEVASDGASIFVRNSKRPDAGAVSFTFAEWEAFLVGADNGEFTVQAMVVN